MVDANISPEALARISRCLEFWKAHGFCYVPLPWLVAPHYINMTKPANIDAVDVSTSHGTLVASGEQSFLKLHFEKKLPVGMTQFVGWTPCFRQEPVFDDTHHFYFMKAEVFIISSVANAFSDMLRAKALAAKWMASEISLDKNPLAHQLTDMRVHTHQDDLLLNGLEVGSYGIRTIEGLTFVYATACAEPRFSQALQHKASPNC